MGAASDSGGDEGNLSRDDCFDLLSNRRRRYALHHLRTNGEESSLGELADEVAACENDIQPEEVSYDQRKRAYTSLQQVHLPRMDDMGVVDFDDREGTVTTRPAAEDLNIYLEVVEERDIPWSLFYLLLALLTGTVVGGAMLGVPLLASVPEYGLATFICTTFLVTSLAHVYLTRTEMQLGEGEPPEA